VIGRVNAAARARAQGDVAATAGIAKERTTANGRVEIAAVVQIERALAYGGVGHPWCGKKKPRAAGRRAANAASGVAGALATGGCIEVAVVVHKERSQAYGCVEIAIVKKEHRSAQCRVAFTGVVLRERGIAYGRVGIAAGV